MSRDPFDTGCDHQRRGIVTTHPRPGPLGNGGHAAADCCGEAACIRLVRAWVLDVSGLEGQWVPDGTAAS